MVFSGGFASLVVVVVDVVCSIDGGASSGLDPAPDPACPASALADIETVFQYYGRWDGEEVAVYMKLKSQTCDVDNMHRSSGTKTAFDVKVSSMRIFT